MIQFYHSRTHASELDVNLYMYISIGADAGMIEITITKSKRVSEVLVKKLI
jgi:hypothetical protein